MLAKRIIPCLDVKDGVVVKGVRFDHHEIVGNIIELASWYSAQGADELVFYDITASCERRTVTCDWVERVAACINIPFCVAGGIENVEDAEKILNAGADKISINSPALKRPDLIDELAMSFGQQCVVVGIDSLKQQNDYFVYQYTGDVRTRFETARYTKDWIAEVAGRGAGEIVLNCMNQDGTRSGYDVEQLALMRERITLPLIASGGAGKMADFAQVFHDAQVDGALAASVFHKKIIAINELKTYLQKEAIEVRI